MIHYTWPSEIRSNEMFYRLWKLFSLHYITQILFRPPEPRSIFTWLCKYISSLYKSYRFRLRIPARILLQNKRPFQYPTERNHIFPEFIQIMIQFVFFFVQFLNCISEKKVDIFFVLRFSVKTCYYGKMRKDWMNFNDLLLDSLLTGLVSLTRV